MLPVFSFADPARYSYSAFQDGLDIPPLERVSSNPPLRVRRLILVKGFLTQTRGGIMTRYGGHTTPSGVTRERRSFHNVFQNVQDGRRAHHTETDSPENKTSRTRLCHPDCL